MNKRGTGGLFQLSLACAQVPEELKQGFLCFGYSNL